jgi:hypothetical protein
MLKMLRLMMLVGEYLHDLHDVGLFLAILLGLLDPLALKFADSVCRIKTFTFVICNI